MWRSFFRKLEGLEPGKPGRVLPEKPGLFDIAVRGVRLSVPLSSSELDPKATFESAVTVNILP
jgi:hypothetical protein